MSDPQNHNDSRPDGANGQGASGAGGPYGASDDQQISAHGEAPATGAAPDLGKRDAAGVPPANAGPAGDPQQGSPYGAPPQQDPQYGGAPQQGSPYGAAPQQGSPYGGQQQGSPYGGAPQQGSPYGAAPQQGSPYGGQQQGSPYGGQQQGSPYGGQPQGAPYGGAPADASQRQIGMFAHLLNIVGVLGPLIIWLVTRERGGLAESEGKEATNWGITVVIASAAIGLLNVIVTFILPPLAFVFVLASIALFVVNLVFAIMGGVQVNSTGRPYRYPFTFRFIA